MKKVFIIVTLLMSMATGSTMAADKQPPGGGAPALDDSYEINADKQPPTS